MHPFRFLLLAAAGCCFLALEALPAQSVAPPFTLNKQYSADLEIMMKDGTTLRGTTYIDRNKVRSEMTQGGVTSVTIIRKDQGKVYVVMADQKMAMQMPYDPDKYTGASPAAFGPEGDFELIGPESSDGIPCMKYKVTSDKNGQAAYFWLDAVNQVPVRMAALDDSFILKWRNFKAGPQDSALFEVPSDYHVVEVPATATMPGAAGQ